MQIQTQDISAQIQSNFDGDPRQHIDARRQHIVAAAQGSEISSKDLSQFFNMFADDPLNHDEAEALFLLEAANLDKCPGWAPFFKISICDHVVWEQRPSGVVNEAQGEWLIRQCDKAATPLCAAVLADVLAQAHRVPGWFGAAVRARVIRAG